MLDLILLDTEDLIHSIKLVPNYSTPIHSVIKFNLSVSLANRSKDPSPQYVYDFGKGDYPELCSYLHDQLLEIENRRHRGAL